MDCRGKHALESHSRKSIHFSNASSTVKKDIKKMIESGGKFEFKTYDDNKFIFTE